MILTRRNRSESGIRLLRFASHLQANAPPPAQPRRDTPVKVRAENDGVVINATPPGVRERIADDGVSPGTLHLARQQLRGHQKAAQKAVERAELKKYLSSIDLIDWRGCPARARIQMEHVAEEKKDTVAQSSHCTSAQTGTAANWSC